MRANSAFGSRRAEGRRKAVDNAPAAATILRGGERHGHRPRKRRPMTIAVGLKYDGGVVLAADSKGGNYTSQAVSKVAERTLGNGVVVFARAGSKSDVDDAKAGIDQYCKLPIIASRRKFRDFARAVIRYVVKRSEGNTDVELLLACRFKRNAGDARPAQTELFMAFYDGKPQVEDVPQYDAIGGGKYMAQYLLKRFGPKRSLSLPQWNGSSFPRPFYAI